MIDRDVELLMENWTAANRKQEVWTCTNPDCRRLHPEYVCVQCIAAGLYFDRKPDK